MPNQNPSVGSGGMGRGSNGMTYRTPQQPMRLNARGKAVVATAAGAGIGGAAWAGNELLQAKAREDQRIRKQAQITQKNYEESAVGKRGGFTLQEYTQNLERAKKSKNGVTYNKTP